MVVLKNSESWKPFTNKSSVTFHFISTYHFSDGNGATVAATDNGDGSITQTITCAADTASARFELMSTFLCRLLVVNLSFRLSPKLFTF